jgi:hypothetical protein
MLLDLLWVLADGYSSWSKNYNLTAISLRYTLY